jgi:hypothetical protein
MAKEKELRHDESSGESIDGLIRRFNQRLESILGSKRIPRAEKRAKAEEAMRAVDELVSKIEAGLSPPPQDD